MLTEIQGAIGSLKAITDIVKGLSSIKNEAEVVKAVNSIREKLGDAQVALLESQSAQLALTNRVRELEEELANIKTWEAEKKRYQLEEIKPGVFTYTLKTASSFREPAHQLCANCFNNQKKSILQNLQLSAGRAEVLNCHTCNNVVYIRGQWMPEHKI